MSQLRKFHVQYTVNQQKRVRKLEVLADRKVTKKMAKGMIARSQDVREAVVDIEKIEEKDHA